MTTNPYDPAKMIADLNWLKVHSYFQEKPASIIEFLGPHYLNIEKGVRPGLKEELGLLFGDEVSGTRIARYERAMFTGAIGIGKTTMASIILPYMCHWCLCLRDPQEYFHLLSGSRIAFMQMSTSEDQAREVVFGDIKARIENSPWFYENYPRDMSFKNQIRFAKDIWVLPGDSAETSFEGYNILGGILDEADSHKITKDKDYAEVGYDAINSRIGSRFDDRGFLLVIGQMKKSSGFAKKKYDEFQKDDKAHTVRMTIWESYGWEKYTKDGKRDSFWYDTKRKEIVPSEAAKLIRHDSKNLIEIPSVFFNQFKNSPEKALRDLAGIPPAAGDPFISLTYKIDDAVERWKEHYRIGSPVNTDPTRPWFEEWFAAPDRLRRTGHLDIAYSGEGDALGFAMGHVSHQIEIEGETKPYIVLDMLFRMKAPPGQEIFLQDVRQMIYYLKDDLNFRLQSVSMDGFQSTDTRQQLRKRRINTMMLSVDKSKLPYEDLRDALYENRIEFPPYMTYLNKGDVEQVEILTKELTELEEGDKMIDHPAGGSKDVADCVAAVASRLMGDRSYRRKLSSQGLLEQATQNGQPDPAGYQVGQHSMPGVGGYGLQAPLPPNMPGFGDLQLPVPPRLQPRGDR